MAKRLKTVLLIVFCLLALFIALAWYDGGRQELREISQPVPLPERLS